MTKEIYTVAWIMEDEPVIKLVEPNETYDIADNVFKYLKENNLLSSLEEKKIEVSIDKNQGQNGTVIFLKILDIKSQQSLNQPKVEHNIEKNNDNFIKKELTVAGVSIKNNGVTFKEEEKVWYTLDSTLDAQKFKDECTKKKVQVSILSQQKGNSVIKAYHLVEQPKEESKPINSDVSESHSPVFKSNDVQKSIEAQASVNSANEVVSQMKDIWNDPQKVLSTITRIAEHNFKLIQELKNKSN